MWSPRVVARVTGIVAILCAVLGLLYNAQTFTLAVGGGFADLVDQYDMAYFYPAFYIMSGICVVSYALLLWCGIRFVRLRLSCAALLALLLAAEVVYFLSIGFLWAALGNGDVGMSVASATGVANGGLMVQFATLFPLWGPVAAIWSRRRMASETITA